MLAFLNLLSDLYHPHKLIKYKGHGPKLKLMKIFICLYLTLLLAACQASQAPQWRWERAEAGLPRQSISLAVAADPADANRLWLGSYTPGGLARSEDGGQTWTSLEVGRAGNPVFDLLLLQPSLLSPSLGGTKGEVWAATRAGLLRSADGGDTWQRTEAGLPTMPVLALAADASGRIYAGLDSAGVYAQTVTGWESLAAPVVVPAKAGGLSSALAEPEAENELLASAGVLALAVSADGRTIYAGTAGRGVFASGDGGQTWVNTYTGAYAPNVVFNPVNPQVAIASLRDRLVRTHDGGQTWHTLPVAWAQEVVVSLLWRADGLLGAGTGQGRLYYSRDGGESWLESSAGLPKGMGILDLAVTPRRLLAATWTGLYGSDDGGESWRYLTPTLGQPNATSLLATETELWLGARTGLFRWQPDSRRWLAVPAEFPPGGITSLAADLSNPQVLYTGSSGDGLYRSGDRGVKWERLPTLGVGVPAVAVDPNDSDRVYHLAAWERVYETRDGGQLWQARWAGMGDTTEAVSIAVDPLKPYVYAGSDTGLYRSYDGQTWRLVAPALADQTILALLVQPAPPGTAGSSILYIGTTRGVYRSLTSGATVQGSGGAGERGGEAWGQGLENISVTALLADRHDPGRLYAGTAYQGVYQSVDWGYTWQPIGPADLTGDVVEEMAWGPGGELFIVAASGVWAGEQQ
jgi:photosystem II stability/assembly factor-like uncharacterized protein